MNVLSLFDGISCGRVALEKAGIMVDKYYSSEIDKYAIQVADKNYPCDTKNRLGDVTKINTNNLPKIDLLIGGSPCQGFSFAGKQLNFEDIRSKLFFEYVNILNHIKKFNPNVKFLLENVSMKKEYRDVISNYLGVSPVVINSALVSAQNRKRLYWCNWKIGQPEDRGILLKDILENQEEKIGAVRGRYLVDGKRADTKIGSTKGLTVQRLEIRKDSKSNCLTTVQKDNNVIINVKNFAHIFKKNYLQYDINGKGNGSQDQRAYYKENKHGTLSSSSGGSKCKVLLSNEKENIYIRKLTPIECERLQTVPDNYTECDGVSKTQRYKMLGNGWTVDVIAHIFKNIKPSEVEQEKQLDLFQ